MMQEIQVPSSADGSLQPSLLFVPESASASAPVPMVVGLHTWSYARDNQRETYLPLCREFGFALLLPEFRGPNLAQNPHAELACGSATARRDILDAVDFVLAANPGIDSHRVFLLGCSGGGHMALLAAALAPERFRAVDVWCPVTDLPRWHRFLVETEQRYSHDMEACLGGPPEDARITEYEARSPVHYLDVLKGVTLSIHHGKQDDTVPYSHSFDFAMALEKRGASALYYDFFDGTHEQYPAHSFEWFARLANSGNSAVRITG